MPEFSIDADYVIRLFLIFVRIGGLFVAGPFFNYPSIPVRIKVLTGILLAYALVGLVPGPLPPHVDTSWGLAIALFVEGLTGIVIGFSAQFVFWAVQYAADLLGFQMGLGMAQIYNPADGTQTNPIGRFFSIVMMLVFLLLDGHHQLLTALVASFEVIPLAGAELSLIGPVMLGWMSQFFLTGLQLAAPFMVTFALVDTSLGIFARLVPQADLFSLGMPLKLLVGLGLIYAYISNLFPILPGLFERMMEQVMEIMEVMVTF